MAENKHTNYDLAQMQSLPLSAKISMTKQRIRGWYDYWNGNVYVAVSGGKDSQVLAHIVKSMYEDVPCVYVRTGLEFSSVDSKGEELADVILRPSMDFVSTLRTRGYPVISKTVSHHVGIAQRKPDGKVIKRYFSGEMKGSRFDCSKYKWLIDAPFRVSDQCCNIMKKKPSHDYSNDTNKKAIVGTMAQESQIRYRNWLKFGCNAFGTGNPTSQPLSFWTEQDILQYIRANDLKIADIYGEVIYVDDEGMAYQDALFSNYMPLKTTGESRTGCVFCMFGITKDTERFLRLKEQEPQKYDYVMRGGKFDEQGMWIPYNGLGYKFVIDWLNEHGNLGIKY